MSGPPLLTEYRWVRGGTAVSGLIFGKDGHSAGEVYTTAAVLQRVVLDGVTQLTTPSGSYRLGEPTAQRASARELPRESGTAAVIQSTLANTCHLLEAHGFSCAAGGVEVGGVEAIAITRAAFAHDSSLMSMQGRYAMARRVVLLKGSCPVAVAVVELTPCVRACCVHSLAVAKASRNAGLGTLLVAVLQELFSRIDAFMLVEPNDESRSFWLRLGFHTSTYAPGFMKSRLRQLEQTLLGGLSKRTMARPVAAANRAMLTETFQPRAVDGGTLARALGQLGRSKPEGVSPANAARARGYRECADARSPSTHSHAQRRG